MDANILLTPPTVEPVSLDEFKSHARLTAGEDDAFLLSLLKGARQWAEAYTRRALIEQTWCRYLSSVSSKRKIALPRGPLLRVNKVEIYDDADEVSLWNADCYFVDTKAVPGAIVLRTGASWPEPGRCANGIVVEYVAGYGSAASAVPEDFKLAIKQLALHWYEHRGEAESASYAQAPLTVEAILQPYRILGVGAA